MCLNKRPKDTVEWKKRKRRKKMKRETYSDMASYSGSALFLDQLEIESGPVLILNEIYMIC
jgi:hypothetical protein